MGMDAKATIFYGYQDSISLSKNLPEYLTIVDDSSGDEYIAVVGSITHYDWDYGVQYVNPRGMIEDVENQLYYDKIAKFVEENNLDEGNIGWFIICDYS